MRFLCSRPGSVFLLSVLAVGAIALATAVSLLLLSGAAERTAYSFQQSLQALEGARTCAEHALVNLRADLSYAGDETLDVGGVSCVVHPIGGSGNGERTLCVEGSADSAIRRLQIRIAHLFPQAVIASWDEVQLITLCP